MVKRRIDSGSLWFSGVVAFTLHSVMVVALAWGMARSEGSLPQPLKNSFCAELVFNQELQEDSLATEVASQRLEPLNRMDDRVPKKLLKKSTAKRRQEGSQNSLPASPAMVPSALSGEGRVAPLFNPPPVYPVEARRRKIQGVVLIRLSLTETGEVDQARPIPPHSDPVLEDAALKAIHQWRFRPGLKILEVPIEFKLMAG
ncbi:MAG: TonB family protein [Alphaproteobacteria bacterium]|jgi:TonB family protein|nr:TonB family protein [Alphaproteobacteria bacterium]